MGLSLKKLTKPFKSAAKGIVSGLGTFGGLGLDPVSSQAVGSAFGTGPHAGAKDGMIISPPSLDPNMPTFGMAFDKVFDDTRSKKKKKGRAASILTGPEGAGLPTTAAAVLLGE